MTATDLATPPRRSRVRSRLDDPALGWTLAAVFGGAMLLAFSVAASIVVALAFLTPVVVIAVRRADRRREVARLKREQPDEPWLRDHEWPPAGAASAPILRGLGKTNTEKRIDGVLTAVVLVLVVVTVRQGGSPGLVVLPWIALQAAHGAWRRWSVGKAHLTFAKFPFHPGERAKFWFGASEGGPSFERVSFRMHRIREIPGTWLFGNNLAVSTLTQTDDRPPGLLPGPDQDVEVAFDLPPTAGGTRLSSRLPEYWLLDVGGETSEGPYAESFLVPIYQRPNAVSRAEPSPPAGPGRNGGSPRPS